MPTVYYLSKHCIKTFKGYPTKIQADIHATMQDLSSKLSQHESCSGLDFHKLHAVKLDGHDIWAVRIKGSSYAGRLMLVWHQNQKILVLHACTLDHNYRDELHNLRSQPGAGALPNADETNPTHYAVTAAPETTAGTAAVDYSVVEVIYLQGRFVALNAEQEEVIGEVGGIKPAMRRNSSRVTTVDADGTESCFGTGVTVITGEPGAGKTLSAQKIIEQASQRGTVVYLAPTRNLANSMEAAVKQAERLDYVASNAECFCPDENAVDARNGGSTGEKKKRNYQIPNAHALDYLIDQKRINKQYFLTLSELVDIYAPPKAYRIMTANEAKNRFITNFKTVCAHVDFMSRLYDEFWVVSGYEANSIGERVNLFNEQYLKSLPENVRGIITREFIFGLFNDYNKSLIENHLIDPAFIEIDPIKLRQKLALRGEHITIVIDEAHAFSFATIKQLLLTTIRNKDDHKVMHGQLILLADGNQALTEHPSCVTSMRAWLAHNLQELRLQPSQEVNHYNLTTTYRCGKAVADFASSILTVTSAVFGGIPDHDLAKKVTCAPELEALPSTVYVLTEGDQLYRELIELYTASPHIAIVVPNQAIQELAAKIFRANNDNAKARIMLASDMRGLSYDVIIYFNPFGEPNCAPSYLFANALFANAPCKENPTLTAPEYRRPPLTEYDQGRQVAAWRTIFTMCTRARKHLLVLNTDKDSGIDQLPDLLNYLKHNSTQLPDNTDHRAIAEQLLACNFDLSKLSEDELRNHYNAWMQEANKLHSQATAADDAAGKAARAARLQAQEIFTMIANLANMQALEQHTAMVTEERSAWGDLMCQHSDVSQTLLRKSDAPAVLRSESEETPAPAALRLEPEETPAPAVLRLEPEKTPAPAVLKLEPKYIKKKKAIKPTSDQQAGPTDLLAVTPTTKIEFFKAEIGNYVVYLYQNAEDLAPIEMLEYFKTKPITDNIVAVLQRRMPLENCSVLDILADKIDDDRWLEYISYFFSCLQLKLESYHEEIISNKRCNAQSYEQAEHIANLLNYKCSNAKGNNRTFLANIASALYDQEQNNRKPLFFIQVICAIINHHTQHAPEPPLCQLLLESLLHCIDHAPAIKYGFAYNHALILLNNCLIKKTWVFSKGKEMLFKAMFTANFPETTVLFEVCRKMSADFVTIILNNLAVIAARQTETIELKNFMTAMFKVYDIDGGKTSGLYWLAMLANKIRGNNLGGIRHPDIVKIDNLLRIMIEKCDIAIAPYSDFIRALCTISTADSKFSAFHLCEKAGLFLSIITAPAVVNHLQRNANDSMLFINNFCYYDVNRKGSILGSVCSFAKSPQHMALVKYILEHLSATIEKWYTITEMPKSEDSAAELTNEIDMVCSIVKALYSPHNLNSTEVFTPFCTLLNYYAAMDEIIQSNIYKIKRLDNSKHLSQLKSDKQILCGLNNIVLFQKLGFFRLVTYIKDKSIASLKMATIIRPETAGDATSTREIFSVVNKCMFESIMNKFRLWLIQEGTKEPANFLHEFSEVIKILVGPYSASSKDIFPQLDKFFADETDELNAIGLIPTLTNVIAQIVKLGGIRNYVAKNLTAPDEITYFTAMFEYIHEKIKLLEKPLTVLPALAGPAVIFSPPATLAPPAIPTMSVVASTETHPTNNMTDRFSTLNKI